MSKVRKLKGFTLKSFHHRKIIDSFYISDRIDVDALAYDSTIFSLKEAERLHKWLGQAIKYLEAKRGKG